MGKAPRPKPARLPEKLLCIRTALKLSQNGMLRRLGLEEKMVRSSITGYEKGEREPPLPVLLEYARAANVYVDVLIDDKLDLPKKLPCRKTSAGIKRTAK
ncbi:MAG: Helix-turn-helix domain [Acidobacteriota bacterium]|jgi:transcriptional regulator with XRE-family HTH domain|nr:Helix-turn-helix domain [Acidobacteriota bacterium]